MIETPYRNTALAEALPQDLHPETLLSTSCGLTLAQGWTQTHAVTRWRQKGVKLPDNVPAVFCWLAA